MGTRYHSYVLDASALKLGDLARDTNLDASLILEATLSLTFLKDNRAWNELYPTLGGPMNHEDVDRLAMVLDSWYSQYASAAKRMFSFVEDFLNVTEVMVSSNEYVLIEVGEEYDLEVSVEME